MVSIDQAKELKALLEEQNKLMAQQTEMLKTQMGVMRQMADTVRQMNIESLGRGIEQLNGAVKNAADAVETLGTGQQTMGNINDAAKESVDNLDNMGQSAERFGRKMLKLAPVVGTLEGMAGGFRLTMNAMTSVISVGSGLISTFFNLTASIIAIPFKMLYGLMNQTGGGGSGLRQEFENVRKTFGDLASNEGKAVIDSWRNISHFGGQLAETGLSVWRTMGNMAESMARLREIAEQMGPLFHNFQRQLATGGERIFAYQKGLHLTEEGLRAVTETAARSGETFQEVGRHITSTAFAMGEAFGMNGALISRDIGQMMDDFEHFGSLGVQELAQVSVYARKLGVEIEKLTGALDQFADFDKAAESVAMLSQAFGLQLDTLELVQEQDPAANIERLRKAFFAAGRSIETMTRQERALLATQTGLDEKTASLVFSQENQALSYADIQKQGESAEKQQLSQAEAMQKLAGSIERLVKSGGALQGGFFDIFLKGFLKGVRRTKEFWTMFRNLRRSMRATFRAGRKVGQLFVKSFPGVRDVLKGIGELFDPRRFRKMLGGVVGAFRNFFRDLTENPDVALPRLLERLKESFFDWFNTSSPAGRRIIDGFKSFGKALVQIFAGLLKQVIKGLTEVFRGITSFISGDPVGAVSGAAADAQDGIMGFLMEMFEPLITFFQSSEGQRMLKNMWEAFKDMMEAAWNFIKPHLISFLEDNWPIILGVLFGPAIIGGAIRGLSTALAGGLVKGLAGGLSGFMRRAPGMIGGAFSKLGGVGSAGNIAAGGQNARALSGAVGGAGEAVEASRRTRISPGDVAKMALLAVVITVGLIGIAVAMTMLAEHIQKTGITTENIKNAAIIMLATGGVMLELAGVIAILAAAGQAIQSFAAQVAVGVVAIGIVGAAMALGAVGMIEAFRVYSESDINRTVMIMGATSLFFMAASAVIGVAALVGTAIVASYGIGALVILAGLAALTTVILAMVETAKQVIEEVNTIRLDSGTQQKMEVFTNVLTAIGGFAANIGEIASATSPGIADLIRGGEPMTDRLDSVANLVETMGESINGVIRNLVEQANTLEGMGEGAMEKARFLAEMLDTIGNVARNLRPEGQFLEVGFIESLGGETVSDRLNELGNYVTRVVRSIRRAIVTIARQFNRIAAGAGFTEESMEAAKAIGAVINSIGQLARMMTIFISREYATTDPAVLRRLAPVLGEVIDAVLSAIVGTSGSNIFTRMVGTIRMVVDAVKGLNRNQLRAVQAAAPIIESTFTVMAAIAALIGNIGLGNAVSGTPEQTEQQVDQLVRVVNAITYGLGNNIRAIINTLVDAFSGISRSTAQNIKTGISALSSFFEAVRELPRMADQFQGESDTMSQASSRLRDFLGATIDLLSGTLGLNWFVDNLAFWLNSIAQHEDALADVMPGFIETMRLTKGAFTAVNRVVTDQAFLGVAEIEDTMLTRAKTGVVAMTNRIGEISDALGRFGNRVVPIDARMRELNNHLGLRSTGRLEIREEPIQFHVSWRVTLDADELEKALLDRPHSRFAEQKNKPCFVCHTPIKTTYGHENIGTLRPGDTIWSLVAGKPELVPILMALKIRVPIDQTMVELRLDDGTLLEATPHHPTVDGRQLGDLKVGDELDGRTVVSTEIVPWPEEYKYDIVPDSDSGAYLANGVWVKTCSRYFYDALKKKADEQAAMETTS